MFLPLRPLFLQRTTPYRASSTAYGGSPSPKGKVLGGTIHPHGLYSLRCLAMNHRRYIAQYHSTTRVILGAFPERHTGRSLGFCWLVYFLHNIFQNRHVHCLDYCQLSIFPPFPGVLLVGAHSWAGYICRGMARRCENGGHLQKRTYRFSARPFLGMFISLFWGVCAARPCG